MFFRPRSPSWARSYLKVITFEASECLQVRMEYLCAGKGARYAGKYGISLMSPGALLHTSYYLRAGRGTNRATFISILVTVRATIHATSEEAKLKHDTRTMG